MFVPMKHLLRPKSFIKQLRTSRLSEKFLKDRTDTNQKNFKLQIFFVKNYWELQKIILQLSGYKNVTDNKTFRKTITPLFTKRPLKGGKITLIENGKSISNDAELFNIFNGFFSNIVSEINILIEYHRFLNDMDWD